MGRYNSPGSPIGQGMTINEEHRVLYRARLTSASISCIRFTDGEVAALGVFSVPELRELIRRYPERIASGLADSMAYYQ